MKRKSENIEKQYIYIIKAKLKAKDYFLVLLRLREYVSI